MPDIVKEIKTTFSNKTKTADTKWRIEFFKQEKQNTANFMIEFEILTIKADTDELYAIFLLKKNMWQDIIKTILEYPPIAAPETLKEWKVVITLVRQGYESTKEHNNYKTGIGITYREWGQPMDIRKSNNNFKDKKPKCFNYNKYRHIAKECQSKKKERETRKCFKCNKEGYIAKNCKGTQSIKKWKIQEESNNKENKKKK